MHRFSIFLTLSVQCLNIAFASFSSSGANSFLSMQQQLQLISEGAAANQPHRLRRVPQVDQKAALLSIVRNVEGEQNERQAQKHRGEGAAVEPLTSPPKDQPLPTISGLEHQLASRGNYQTQLNFQDSSRIYPLSTEMWHKCNALRGLILSATVSLCFFFSVLFTTRSKPKKEMCSSNASKERINTDVSQEFSPEVSAFLADLAFSVEKVNMPSDRALQTALQAMEASGLGQERVASQPSMQNELSEGLSPSFSDAKRTAKEQAAHSCPSQ
jgi:hypothetical protein